MRYVWENTPMGYEHPDEPLNISIADVTICLFDNGDSYYLQVYGDEPFVEQDLPKANLPHCLL